MAALREMAEAADAARDNHGWDDKVKSGQKFVSVGWLLRKWADDIAIATENVRKRT